MKNALLSLACLGLLAFVPGCLCEGENEPTKAKLPKEKKEKVIKAKQDKKETTKEVKKLKKEEKKVKVDKKKVDKKLSKKAKKTKTKETNKPKKVKKSKKAKKSKPEALVQAIEENDIINNYDIETYEEEDIPYMDEEIELDEESEELAAIYENTIPNFVEEIEEINKF